MVVCKFFQQGHCRFGQGCRFEHSYPSKYTYNANSQQQQSSFKGPSAAIEDQLTAQSIADAAAVIHGGQWPLSSYTPFSGKPTFPGFTNLSPEEARLFIYEAKANNTLDKAVAYINQMTQDAKSKYEQLSRPTQQIIKVYRSLYNGENAASPFSNAASNPFGSNTESAFSNPQSVFSSAPINQNAFSQPNQAQSIFAQAPQSVFAAQPQSNVFAGSQPNPGSIFASATQNVFAQPNQNSPGGGQSIFQNQAQSVFAQAKENTSIFAQANQANTNVFAQAKPDTTSIFAQAQPNTTNVFAQAKPDATNVFAQAKPDPSNVFAQAKPDSSSIFSQNTFAQAGQALAPTSSNVFGQSNYGNEDTTMYSKLEELSQDDIEMYKCSDFKLGLVPEMPPPHSLCM